LSVIGLPIEALEGEAARGCMDVLGARRDQRPSLILIEKVRIRTSVFRA
jgi:hypothetical protein